jgi:hypothetical protein
MGMLSSHNLDTVCEQPQFMSPQEKPDSFFKQSDVSFEASPIRWSVRRQVRPERLPQEGFVNFLGDAFDARKHLQNTGP